MEKPITLGQFLKSVEIINSGGEAKHFLANYTIYVNGEIERRRGRKLVSGDTVVFQDMTFTVE